CARTGRHLSPSNGDWCARTEPWIRRAQAVLSHLELALGLPATQPALPGFLEGARGECVGVPCITRRPAGSGLCTCLKKEVNHEHRRCTVGPGQAGRHPVVAALRDDAQGITGSAESTAVCPGQARTVTSTAHKPKVRTLAPGLLRR